MTNGADGVFLISHGDLSSDHVVQLADGAVRAGVSFVGVNLLGLTALESLGAIGSSLVHGLWCDDAVVRDHDRLHTLLHASEFRRLRQDFAWDGLYFGGIAFKGGRGVPHEALGATARLARDSGVDIVTTSGPRTGAPPTRAKIAAMREALGPDAPLAIASGVGPENVALFLDLTDVFIIASSLETAHGILDASRVRATADAIHGIESRARGSATARA